MWLKKSEYEQLVSQAARSGLVDKAEERIAELEESLATERRENRKAERHFASMWLRKNGSYPLPATAEEKKEAKIDADAKKNRPPELTADQLARREAVRAYAKSQGYTQEEADKKFMAQLHEQVDVE